MLLSLIYSQCADWGHLSEVDALRADACGSNVARISRNVVIDGLV